MLKLFTTALIVVSLASLSFGQNSSEDYHKVEVSVGYSHIIANGILGDGELFSDDKDEPYAIPDNPNAFPNFFVDGNSENVFARTPFVVTGKRHRAKLNGFNASAVYNFSKHLGIKFEVSGHYRSNEVAPVNVVTSFPYNNTTNLILPIQGPFPAGTTRPVILLGAGHYHTRQKHYNYLGGLQFKNNSKEKRFKPFAHAMAGISRQSVKFKDFNQASISTFGSDKFTNTGFTMAFGGGIDIRLGKRIDLRVIQFDYNPVKIKQQQILESRQPLTNLGMPNTLSFKNLETATLFSASDVRIDSRWQNNFRIGVGIVFH